MTVVTQAPEMTPWGTTSDEERAIGVRIRKTVSDGGWMWPLVTGEDCVKVTRMYRRMIVHGVSAQNIADLKEEHFFHGTVFLLMLAGY